MTNIKSVVSILGVVVPVQIALANSDTVAYPENGHSYQRIDTEKTWQDAKDFCEEQGGYLATITSEAENRFVYDQVGKDGLDLWLGGTDRYSEGTWEWITGETWDYEHWGSGEPNDSGGEDYLIFSGKFPTEWNDAGLPASNNTHSFICEWNNTDGVDDPISLAREEGRQQCIDDPASCGITIYPGKSQHAVYKPQAGELYIPFVDVPDAFGGITVYEVTLMQQPPSLIFEVKLDKVKPVSE
ncbi:MAG: C-type lectin domain-containing protein [Desulfobacteraceae bacterium]|nr:C-type lectin domain-containing protein [Desulfobacteraceae bacterium]